MTPDICQQCHTFLHHSATTCYYCGQPRYQFKVIEDRESNIMRIAALAQSGPQRKLERRWWVPDKEHWLYD